MAEHYKCSFLRLENYIIEDILYQDTTVSSIYITIK